MSTSSLRPAVLAPRTGPSWLSDRNPTVKLALVFALSLVMLFVFDPITPTLLYTLALTALITSVKMPARTLALAHIPFLTFAIGVFLVNAFSRPGDAFWHFGVLQITIEGMSVGAALAMRTMVIGILSIAFIATTDPVALTTSLHHNARLSARVTFAILAGYRMLQELRAEWQTIRQAHAVRSPLRPDRTLPRGVRELARAAFTLMVVSVRKGERIAQALESRGLGLNPRSTWRPARLGRSDWLLAAGVLSVLAGTLALGAVLGYLQGFAALSSDK